MTKARGTAERPLATQIESLLAGTSVPKAKWSGSELTSGGYQVIIAGGGCVEIGYVDARQSSEQRRSHLAQLVQVLQKHYGDNPVEIQESTWRVQIDSSQLVSDYPKIHVRLHWITTCK